jgi:hypothetical protein
MKYIKNITFVLLFVLIGLPRFILANDFLNNKDSAPDLYDESEIYNSFEPIDELTKSLQQDETISPSDYEHLISTNTVVNAGARTINMQPADQFTFDKTTAYFMGCCFGFLGILAVAIIDNGHTSAVKSSVWGCVTSGCVAGIPFSLFILYYFSFFFYF